MFRVKPDDENLGALLEMFTQFYREPVIVQRYVPEVRKGDKRIILVDGEYRRRDQSRAGGGRGALQHACRRQAGGDDADRREKEICAALGPELKARGLIFTGIDVIGDYLTEINVTSPTGIQEVKRFGGAGHRGDDLGCDRSGARRYNRRAFKAGCSGLCRHRNSIRRCFMLTIRKSQERGATKIGWLDSKHSFSFGDYYDPQNVSFGPLRVINEDWIAGGGGFAPHGHRDMEIVTYLIDGALQHRIRSAAAGLSGPAKSSA